MHPLHRSLPTVASKAFPLGGKVKIVDHFPDIKVKVVSSFPAACGCGEGGDDFGRIYTPK